MIHENRNPAVVEVPKSNTGDLYYDINDRFVELHTQQFCLIICTVCRTPYHCRKRITNSWFAKFETEVQKADERPTLVHYVEIRPYFGGILHTTVEFRKVHSISIMRL